MSEAMAARLTAVGMGPGDPGLLTLKGLSVLEAADVLFAPTRRDGGPSLALAIAASAIDLSGRTVVPLPFPAARGAGVPARGAGVPARGAGVPARGDWRGVASTIASQLGRGGAGALLVEGDPMLFSSFGHVLRALRAEAPWIQVSVVPGISSVAAAAAAAEVTLGHHDQGVAVVSATDSAGRLRDALERFDVVAILKVGTDPLRTLRALEQAGRLDEAVYLRDCTRQGELVVRDVRSLAHDLPRDYWSLILVGGTSS